MAEPNNQQQSPVTAFLLSVEHSWPQWCSQQQCILIDTIKLRETKVCHQQLLNKQVTFTASTLFCFMDITDTERQQVRRILSLLGFKCHLKAPKEERMDFKMATEVETTKKLIASTTYPGHNKHNSSPSNIDPPVKADAYPVSSYPKSLIKSYNQCPPLTLQKISKDAASSNTRN